MTNLLYTQAHIRDIVDNEIYDTCREMLTEKINRKSWAGLWVKIQVNISHSTWIGMRDNVFNQIKKEL